MFRSALEIYAPNLASLFKHPGVEAVKLNNFTADTIEAFVKRLRKQDEDAHLESGVHGETMKWDHMTESRHWDTHAFLSTDMSDCELDTEVAERCIDMFIFAEAYDIPILRIDSINRLVLCFDDERKGYMHWSRQPISTESIHRAYNSTNLESPLRQIIVAAFCQETQVMRVDMPSQFLVDGVTYYQEVDKDTGAEWPSMPTICEFHEHDTKEGKKHCQQYTAWLEGVQN
jgi:hypothetical protein